jgi:hypothetical protein
MTTGYPEFTVTTSQRQPNPYRKNAYDPDFTVGTSSLTTRYANRWKGYNGYWKTLASLKLLHPPHRVYAATPKFNVAYHYNNNKHNLTDIRRRGMYGY